MTKDTDEEPRGEGPRASRGTASVSKELGCADLGALQTPDSGNSVEASSRRSHHSLTRLQTLSPSGRVGGAGKSPKLLIMAYLSGDQPPSLEPRRSQLIRTKDTPFTPGYGIFHIPRDLGVPC